jgi:hypothetical protein
LGFGLHDRLFNSQSHRRRCSSLKEGRGFCARFRAKLAKVTIATAVPQITCGVRSCAPQVATPIRRKVLTSKQNKNFRQAHWRALYAWSAWNQLYSVPFCAKRDPVD